MHSIAAHVQQGTLRHCLDIAAGASTLMVTLPATTPGELGPTTQLWLALLFIYICRFQAAL